MNIADILKQVMGQVPGILAANTQTPAFAPVPTSPGLAMGLPIEAQLAIRQQGIGAQQANMQAEEQQRALVQAYQAQQQEAAQRQAALAAQVQAQQQGAQNDALMRQLQYLKFVQDQNAPQFFQGPGGGITAVTPYRGANVGEALDGKRVMPIGGRNYETTQVQAPTAGAAAKPIVLRGIQTENGTMTLMLDPADPTRIIKAYPEKEPAGPQPQLGEYPVLQPDGTYAMQIQRKVEGATHPIIPKEETPSKMKTDLESTATVILMRGLGPGMKAVEQQLVSWDPTVRGSADKKLRRASELASDVVDKKISVPEAVEKFKIFNSALEAEAPPVQAESAEVIKAKQQQEGWLDRLWGGTPATPSAAPPAAPPAAKATEWILGPDGRMIQR